MKKEQIYIGRAKKPIGSCRCAVRGGAVAPPQSYVFPRMVGPIPGASSFNDRTMSYMKVKQNESEELDAVLARSYLKPGKQRGVKI